MNERELVDLLPKEQYGVLIPIGDDCGEIEWPSSSLLASCDLLIDGEHFDTTVHSPEQIAFKCLRVNISDIAAMAGKPVTVLLAVAFSRKLPGDFGNRFLKSFSRCCEADGVVLLGGDTNFCDGPSTISVTIIGQPHAKGSVKRSGARVSDDIYVTGPLGGSLKSGRHMRPPRRIELAQKIVDSIQVHSMIDLSDGLATDLRHILKEGHVGAKLYLSMIPMHADVERVEEALTDGEDFELCFTASREARSILSRLGCHRIGEIIDVPEKIFLEGESGKLEIFELLGFEHRSEK